MKVLIFDSAAEANARATRLLIDAIRARPDAVIGFASGRTFEPIFTQLITAFRAGAVSFRDVTSFNLDEYVGLSASHPQSYRNIMRRLLFDHIDIDPARAHVPDGAAADPDAEAARYEAAILAAGGIDLQLVGIGGNGHIGFNEPGSSLGSRTRVKDLAPATIAANQSAFAPGETMPRQAITVGVGTILGAREICLLATGAAKAAALQATIEGPISAFVPATALQLHPAVTAICDAPAAAQLTLADYYRSIDHGD